MAKPPRASAKARRTAARLAAVQALYQQTLSGVDLVQVKSDFLEHYAGADLDGDQFVAPEESLWLSILDGIDQYSWQIDEAIAAAVHAAQPGRKVENTELLLKTILRCGVFELLHTATEKPIIINEYVDVAKAFYEGKEPGFVNAVLEQVARQKA